MLWTQYFINTSVLFYKQCLSFLLSLVPVPVDLSKLNEEVKNNVAKKDVYNAKIKNLENEILVLT